MLSTFLLRWFWLPFSALAVLAISQPPVGDVSAGPTPPVVDQQIIATYRSGPVTLTGAGLGDAASFRTLLIESGVQSIVLTAESPLVQVWQGDLVEFSLPDGVQSGNLTVEVDGIASGPVELLVFDYESFDIPPTVGTNELPIALAMAPDDSLWIIEEFHLELKAFLPGPPRNPFAVTVPRPAGAGIFAQAFLGDASTTISTLGEDIAVDGDGNVWFTQGGGYLYSGPNPNTSRLVRYDPASGAFGCFNVPADNAEIVGVLIDESRQMVWYSEGGLTNGNGIAGITLDSTLSNCNFSPHGGDLRDPFCAEGADPNCHWRFPLPQPLSNPAHLALDAAGDIWFTEFWGNRIGRLTPETGEIIELPLPAAIARAGPGIDVGSGPWELGFDDNGYLWVGEFFDATLLRVDPSLMTSADCENLNSAGQNPCVEEIVVASDGLDEKTMHSIAIGAGGRVWFAVTESGVDGDGAQVGFVVPARGNETVLLPEIPDFRQVAGMVVDPDTSGLWFLESVDRQVGHLTQLPPAVEDGTPEPRVIVLGDSIAAGCCIGGAPGWAAQFADQLGAQLNNVAVSKLQSGNLLNLALTWPSGNTHSQLAEALYQLDVAPTGSVRAVALGIGVNDWFWQRDPITDIRCIDIPTPGCDALIDSTMVSFRSNLHEIVTELQAHLEPGVPLLIMAYYGLPYDYGLQEMNAVIADEIAEHGATLVDVFDYFDGRLDELVLSDRLHASPAGHDLIADIFTNAVPPDSDADGLSDAMEDVMGTDMSAPDTDADGCADGEEFAPDAELGGRRDPLNPWDFYDVPRMDAARDGEITLLTDILGVVLRVGTRDAGGTATVNRYSDPLAPPEDTVSYHPAFDRSSPPPGENQFALGPPDGSIDLWDLLGVIFQYGHSC